MWTHNLLLSVSGSFVEFCSKNDRKGDIKKKIYRNSSLNHKAQEECIFPITQKTKQANTLFLGIVRFQDVFLLEGRLQA